MARQDELDVVEAVGAAVLNNVGHIFGLGGGGPGGGGGAPNPAQMLAAAGQLQAVLAALQEAGGGQRRAVGAGVLELGGARAPAPNGGGPAPGLQVLAPPLGLLAQQLAQLNIGGGGDGGGGDGGGGAGGGGNRGGAASAPLDARVLQLQLAPLSPHMCFLNLALVPMVTQLAMMGGGGGGAGAGGGAAGGGGGAAGGGGGAAGGGAAADDGGGGAAAAAMLPPADTRVAPVLLDVRGAGYTQLKSLAVTGYVDQDCRPAAWMCRGWLAGLPAAMPSLEYLALYDTLPAAAHDREAVKVGRGGGGGRGIPGVILTIS